MRVSRNFSFTLIALALLPLLAPPIVSIKPAVTTDKVANDPDDPAIWVHPTTPAQSLIVGTNKVSAAEGGALYVFGLDGKIRQVLKGLDRPNNVDVEYGLKVGSKKVDIAVVTERNQKQLRIFRFSPNGLPLVEAGRIPVFTGQTGEDFDAPMGIGLYKRPRDGAIFAIVGRKSGPSTGYLWQYRLKDDGKGGITGVKVREFGTYSGKKEIEAIAVDDEKGFVYYADETYGIHKWSADPDSSNAGKELALFATTGYKGDHEGIALWKRPDGTGYLICTDQIAGNAEYHVYRREGSPTNPHNHTELGIIRGGADETDGIEATSANLGPAFPHGLLVTMDSTPRDFMIFDWRAIDTALKIKR